MAESKMITLEDIPRKIKFCPYCGSWNIQLSPLGEENLKVICESCGEEIYNTIEGFTAELFVVSTCNYASSGAIIIPLKGDYAMRLTND